VINQDLVGEAFCLELSHLCVTRAWFVHAYTRAVVHHLFTVWSLFV